MITSAIAFGIVIAIMVSISETKVKRFKDSHNRILEEQKKRDIIFNNMVETTEEILEEYEALYSIVSVTVGAENVDQVIKEVKDIRRAKKK